MGIEKSDSFLVFIFDLPKSIENSAKRLAMQGEATAKSMRFYWPV